MTRRPRHGGVALLPALVLAAVLLSLGLGSKAIGIDGLWQAARGQGDPFTRSVVASRVPRTLCGLLAGAALAVSGAAVQVATRNPLGDPGVLGLTSGAAAGVVLASTWSVAAPLGLVGGAFVGALLATVAVLALGSLGRGPDSTRLLLAGAVVTAVAMAFTQSLALRDAGAFDALRYWSAGSLAAGAALTWPVLSTAGAGALLLAGCSRGLDALALGDDAATALGQRPGLIRAVTFLAVALLTSAATAVTGPIAFIGLAVPHLARSVAGSGARALLACCLLLGPVVLLLADITGRLVARPSEIPVGVVTGLLGAPLLLLVVRRAKGAL
ncbi:iron ABC transporter permease [Luteococcus sp. H138]|uniref:FecCD family ABC transporter permease n=1 Tax=unclassified Luteococcus TaxID=2639923 RepID=UPI00313B0FA8